MRNKVEFCIVQHVPDLLRRESKNVGVVVSDGRRLRARFLGEIAPGDLDLRRVPPSIVPDKTLYAEWHANWGRALASREVDSSALSHDDLLGDPRIQRLLREAKPGYEVQVSGEWYTETPIDTDLDLDRVVLALYRRIVDTSASAFGGTLESGQGDAVLPRRSHWQALQLEATITEVFRQRQILGQTPDVFTPHPVRLNYPVRGKNPVPHVPKFVQDNGSRYVMEHVDFNVANPEIAREHAAYTAYMLSDILKAVPNSASSNEIVSIAVVNRVTDAEARRQAGGDAFTLVEAQEYGLAVLAGADQAVRLVHWDDPSSRERFIEERVAIARGSLI